MTSLIARLVCILFFFGGASAGAESPHNPVIDVHLHLWSATRLPAAKHLRGFKGADSRENLAKETLAQMQKHNVVLGLVHEDPASIELITKLDPDRFIGFPKAISPDGVPTAKALDKNLTSRTWGGIGEILTVYGGTRANEKRLDPFYDAAMRHDVPIFWHTGISFPGVTLRDAKFRATLGRPTLWEETLVRYPKMKGVLMHAGWPFRDEIVALLLVYPWIHVDTGAVVHLENRKGFYDYFGYLIDSGLSDRIMFGSDQMGWPDAIGYSISVIDDAPWPDEIKRDILYNNAARLLGLSQIQKDAHHRELEDSSTVR